MYRYIVVLVISLTLTACFNLVETSSGSSSDKTTQDPSGIWIGTQSVVGTGAFDMKTIIYDGKIFGISEDAGVMYAGTYEMKKGRFLVSDGRANSSTSYNLYDLYDNNKAFAIGIVDANIEQQQQFNGSFTNTAGQEGELTSYYSMLYDRAVSIADIQGSHTTSKVDINIDGDGIMTGTYDGCSVYGSISTPESDKNIFKVETVLKDCSVAGSYDGLGVVSADDSCIYFMAMTANTDRMEAFAFPLSSVPESFKTEEPVVKALDYNTDKSLLSARSVTFATEYGGNHDGEDFTNLDIHYNVQNGSYCNAVFNKTSFAVSVEESYQCFPVGFAQSNSCTRWVFYTPTITDSDFSGSTFDKSVLGGYNTSTYVQTPTVIKNSNFSGSSFTGSGGSGRRFLISATDTDFSGSTFNNYDMSIDNVSNNFNGSEFINSKVTLADGNLENATFTSSSLTINKENTNLKNVTINNGTLLVNANTTFENVVLNNCGLVVNSSDAIDRTGLTINGTTSVDLYQDSDISGWNLSNSTVLFHQWKTFTPYLLFTQGHASGTFTGTNFSGSTIVMPLFYDDAIKDQEATYVADSDFTRADFSSAVFSRVTNADTTPNFPIVGLSAFYKCDFTAANFSNADLANANFQFSTLNYANFKGATPPPDNYMFTSSFGNAWWFDGTRCLPGSIATCISVPSSLNTGLTYEEYLSGKDDLDKAAENIKNKAQETANQAVSFIKDTTSSVKHFFGL